MNTFFNKIKRGLAVGLLVFVSLISVVPILTYAAASGDTNIPTFSTTLQKCSKNPGGCQWTDLVGLVNDGIKFLLAFTVLLAIISFTYAGWLYMTSGGDSGQVSKAHEVFKKVAYGIVIAFTAWLIVQLIISTLGLNPDYSLVK